MGPIKNQDFTYCVEFLEKQFMNLKQEFSKQISYIKMILKENNTDLDDDKLSTLFIRLYRFGRYKNYQYKCLCSKCFIIVKKSISNINYLNINFSNINILPTNVFRANKNKILVSTCIAASMAISVFTVNNYLFNTVAVEAQPDNIVDEDIVDPTQFSTINVNGQRFATDGTIISQKLNSCDFYNNGKKVVYLTFDDGPTKYTPEILEILKKYNIRATFFTTGTALKNSSSEIRQALKDSYTYGNSIGNHSYSHDYQKLYPNGELDLNEFNIDFERNLTLLRSILGNDFNTNIIRCPGGFNSWKNMNFLKAQLDSKGQSYIDWNALTGDTLSYKNSPVEMIKKAKETSKDKNLVVLLMHETNKYTPKYLDEVIRYYYDNGYEFRTIA